MFALATAQATQHALALRGASYRPPQAAAGQNRALAWSAACSGKRVPHRRRDIAPSLSATAPCRLGNRVACVATVGRYWVCGTSTGAPPPTGRRRVRGTAALLTRAGAPGVPGVSVPAVPHRPEHADVARPTRRAAAGPLAQLGAAQGAPQPASTPVVHRHGPAVHDGALGQRHIADPSAPAPVGVHNDDHDVHSPAGAAHGAAQPTTRPVVHRRGPALP